MVRFRFVIFLVIFQTFGLPFGFLILQPEKFDPDRFLPEETEKRPSFSYLPFGLGQRQCIGTKLALLEMKIALVMILQRIKFEKGLGTTENLEFKADGFILRSRDPIFVKLVRRSLDNE